MHNILRDKQTDDTGDVYFVWRGYVSLRLISLHRFKHAISDIESDYFIMLNDQTHLRDTFVLFEFFFFFF